MRKTQVILIDDLDGTEAERTVRFGFDGDFYEIELNTANIEKLKTALVPYIEKATKVSRKRGGEARHTPAGPSLSQSVRTWAKQQGIPISDRGRVPGEIIEIYKAANE